MTRGIVFPTTDRSTWGNVGRFRAIVGFFVLAQLNLTYQRRTESPQPLHIPRCNTPDPNHLGAMRRATAARTPGRVSCDGGHTLAGRLPAPRRGRHAGERRGTHAPSYPTARPRTVLGGAVDDAGPVCRAACHPGRVGGEPYRAARLEAATGTLGLPQHPTEGAPALRLTDTSSSNTRQPLSPARGDAS